MAFDKPWMIGGGVEHEVEVARLLAYAATSGAEGIVEPNDLRVRQLETPGTKVRVAPGAAVIRNRFPGGSQQSYLGRSPIQQEVSVTATGSSGGRTDLVVARIHDPQYAGPTPPDVQDFDYARVEIIEGVSSGTRSARDLNLSYPAIALARLTLPLNTGTILAEHVVDLRAVAQPRKYRELFTYNLAANGVHELDRQASTYWPNIPEEQWWVDVPEWATFANVVGTWGGVKMTRSSASGKIWVRIGSPPGYGQGNVETAQVKWSGDLGGQPGDELRYTWMSADAIRVPAALRGTRQRVSMLGNRDTLTGNTPKLDSYSAMLVDVEFQEVAD